MTELTLIDTPLVDRLQRVADQEQTTAEALLIQAVTLYLAQKEVKNEPAIGEHEQEEVYTAFEQEVAAFEQLKPQLLQQYAGKVVAIYQGEVVAVGEDRLQVHDQVIEQYGNVPCYIEDVRKETPRLARITSAWKAK